MSEHLIVQEVIRPRYYVKLFQLVRQRASTKIREPCIHDDAAIVAYTLDDTRWICKHFEQAATMFELTISTENTVILYQPLPGQTC